MSDRSPLTFPDPALRAAVPSEHAGSTTVLQALADRDIAVRTE